MNILTIPWLVGLLYFFKKAGKLHFQAPVYTSYTFIQYLYYSLPTSQRQKLQQENLLLIKDYNDMTKKRRENSNYDLEA